MALKVKAESDELPLCSDVPEEECKSVCVVPDGDWRDVCHRECSKIKCRVRAQEKCKIDPFWANLLDGNPGPFKTLTGEERDRVAKALSKLPIKLRPSVLKAIVKSSSSDFLSPANPAMSSGEFIIFFPSAFSTGGPLERTMLHEVVHEMAVKEWSRQFADYKRISGWDKTSGKSPRIGSFVEDDSKDSAEEDFANNIEYYIFEPEKLKSTSPNLYSWITKNLKAQLKMEKGCNDDKNSKD